MCLICDGAGLDDTEKCGTCNGTAREDWYCDVVGCRNGKLRETRDGHFKGWVPCTGCGGKYHKKIDCRECLGMKFALCFLCEGLGQIRFDKNLVELAAQESSNDAGT